jgi:hypothetical protein
MGTTGDVHICKNCKGYIDALPLGKLSMAKCKFHIKPDLITGEADYEMCCNIRNKNKKNPTCLKYKEVEN